MEITKKELIDGISNFAKNEIINKVPDKSLKLVINIGVSLLKKKPEFIDEILNNKMVSILVKSTDEDKYDLDDLFEVLTDAVAENGNIDITVQPIPFLSSQENILTFTRDDVKKLKEYIEGE